MADTEGSTGETGSSPDTDSSGLLADSPFWSFDTASVATVTAGQILVTIALVLLTTPGQLFPQLPELVVDDGVRVPTFVYVYATLGAAGAFFMNAINRELTLERVGDWSLKVFAALPLAAGVYLLAALLLPDQTAVAVGGAANETATVVSTTGNTTGTVNVPANGTTSIRLRKPGPPPRIMAGLALLTGLFVEPSYRGLHTLAKRWLGSGGDGEESGDDDTDELLSPAAEGDPETTDDGESAQDT
jgi:hypothetical protein